MPPADFSTKREVTGTVSSDDALAAWVHQSFFRVMMLEEWGIHDDDDVDLDSSGNSLRGLEELLLGYFDTPDHIYFDGLDAADAEPVSVEGIAGYLGETLIRLVAGSWDWAPAERFPDGVPLVRPPAVLGLDPVSPVHLMRDAVRIRDGEQFTAVFQSWEHAVEEAKAGKPSWWHPGQSDRLVEWLTRRSVAFTEWVSTYAPNGNWDYSPDSLPALEELVRRVTPTAAELHDVAHRDFRDGAAWYQGEVMRRGLGGRWYHVDGVQDDRNFEYLDDVGPWGSISTPVLSLEAVFDEPGFLNAHYDDFST